MNYWNEIEVDGVAGFNEGFIKSVFHKNSIVNKNEWVEQLRSVVYSNSKHIIIAGLVALAKRSETCSTLNGITIPTLIICGREDEVTPLVQSEFMNATIKGSILHVIDNAGHVSNLEQPHEFNRHLLGFLTGLSGPNVENLKGNKLNIKWLSIIVVRGKSLDFAQIPMPWDPEINSGWQSSWLFGNISFRNIGFPDAKLPPPRRMHFRISANGAFIFNKL